MSPLIVKVFLLIVFFLIDIGTGGINAQEIQFEECKKDSDCGDFFKRCAYSNGTSISPDDIPPDERENGYYIKCSGGRLGKSCRCEVKYAGGAIKGCKKTSSSESSRGDLIGTCGRACNSLNYKTFTYTCGNNKYCYCGASRVVKERPYQGD